MFKFIHIELIVRPCFDTYVVMTPTIFQVVYTDAQRIFLRFLRQFYRKMYLTYFKLDLCSLFKIIYFMILNLQTKVLFRNFLFQRKRNKHHKLTLTLYRPI